MFKRKHKVTLSPSEILHDAVQTTFDVRQSGVVAEDRLKKMEEDLAKLRRQSAPITNVLVNERVVHS